MNPLLNRIYHSQNRKLSKNSKHSNNNTQEQVLIPKLNTKVKLQAILTPSHTDREAFSLHKPHISRLPSLQKDSNRQQISMTEKKYQHQSKSRSGFRSRRLSSHLKDNQVSFLNNQTSILKDQQILKFKDIKRATQSKTEKKIFFQDAVIGKMDNVFQKITAISKQPLPLPNKTNLLEENNNKRKTQKLIPASQIKVQKHQARDQQEDQLFEYLKVLEQNQDLNEEFCYMNRGQKPYSFYIVDYDKRNLKQHLTVSLRGVTIYKTEGDESHHEFFTIKNLTKQIRRYKILKKISFFKNYLYQKVINHWKLAMISNKFQNQCDFLTENLLSQNFINQKYFYQLNLLYQKFSYPNFINFDPDEAIPSLKEIKQKFMEPSVEKIQKDSQFFQRQLKVHLIECLKQNMTKFRIEKRVTVGTQNKLQGSQSFLPFDNKKKAMKFTQLAKIKQFQSYLYKILKYTDMMRYNLKIQQAKNGLINSRKQMQHLFQNYQNRNSRAFISWIQCKVQITKEKILSNVVENPQIQAQQSSFLTSETNLMPSKSRKKSTVIKQTFLESNNSQKSIRFNPQIQQIRSIFQKHKQQCIKQFWQSHTFLTQQKAQFFCQQVQIQQTQFPTKLDLKYYIQNSPELVELNKSFSNSLMKILDEMINQKNKLAQNILAIYNDSFLQQPMENYLQNQRLKAYLDSYVTNKEKIQKCEQVVQFGLVILKIDSFKAEVKKVFEEKYKAIITAIPQQVLKRTQLVARQVRDLYFTFKQNPQTIREFIDFYKVFQTQKSKLFLVQQKIQDLLELQAMVSQNGIKMPQNSKINIAESQSLFRDLQKRFEQIDVDQEKLRKKFQIQIDEMIPVIEEKAQYLLKQLSLTDELNDSQTPIDVAWQKFNEFQSKFIKVKSKKQDLFSYQEQLKLGHKDLQNYFKLQHTFEWYHKIWLGFQEYDKIYKITKQKGYGQVDKVDTLILTKHLQNVQKDFEDIQAVQLFQTFRSKTLRITKVIKLSKLIATETLQQEHCQKIKGLMTFKVKKIKDLIFTRQGSRTITCNNLYENTNISQIEAELQNTAFLSGRQSAINKELNEIQDLWKKTKLKFRNQDIVGNGNLVLRLDTNEELQQKIGVFSLSLKNIQKSGHAVGVVLQRLHVQIKITKYLTDLLQLWAQVEKQWLKLLPLMTNCPSVKHQSNVFYEFSGVDNSMKKLIKQISEMSSLRRLAEDHDQQKYLSILQKCRSELKQINLTLERFLETKRSLYSRFNFLTDQELINIIQNVKDSKSMARFGGYCFNCQNFEMQNQLISGMETPQQTFKLRKAMLRGEPEEMFRSIEENMRTSIRMSIKALIPKMKVSPNIEQQLTQNSLQLCLLGDLILWTEMGQNYLNEESYDEYFLIVKRLYQEMTRLLPKIDKQLWLKLSIRLTQAINLKQQSQNLIIEQTSRNDFKWKSTIKFYLEEEQVSIKQFDMRLNYGLQYYPPNKIYIPTQNTQALLNQMYYSCLHYKLMNVSGPQGQGKRSLIKYTASRLGIYCQEVVCNQNLSINYLERLLNGTLNAGAWLTFYESYNLKPSVAYELFQKINQVLNGQTISAKTLYILANHQEDSHQNIHHVKHQPINVYKYHSYTLVQPDHKQISNYLFQMYRFRDWELLSNQLTSYMKTIQPLIQNVIGTPLSLLRKVIDAAGAIKIASSNAQDETKMVVDIIYRQIIDKSDDKVANLLKKGLSSYFNFQQPITDPKLKYFEKLQIFKQILTRKETKNVLMIGNRSCKSTLISEAIRSLNIDFVKLFPESQSNFLTSFSIDELNSFSSQKILIYDGDEVISQFVDIITSGYLLVDGKKLTIKSKIVIQLRNLNNCAPSFIQNCQIIYIGNIVTKWQKFLKLCPLQQKDQAFKIVKETFGQELQKLQNQHLETIAKLVNHCNTSSQSSSIHKLIIWLLSVFKSEELWQRNYPGKYTDFTINQKSFQLTPIDLSHSSLVQFLDTNFYYVPTKSTVLLTGLTKSLVNLGLRVHAYGSQQIGKTTFLKFFASPKTHLSIHHQTENWAQKLKNKLSIIRKQGRNFLIPIGETQLKVFVDDLDLGTISHQSFLRSLIETSELRDQKYQSYFLESFSLVTTSRNRNLQSKLDQCVIKIPFINQSKQTLSTIFVSNINHFTKKNNFNREVVDYFDNTVIKALFIAFDDLTNIFDENLGFSLLISLVKDLVSIPKKNSFISIQDFQSLFKSLLYQKLTQKTFNKKITWQLNSVYENIAKILFQNKLQNQNWINLRSQYNRITNDEIRVLIEGQFQNLIIYPQLVEKLIFINNHLQNINGNIAIIGRKGVGKKYLLQMAAWLNKIQIVYDIRDAIFKAIKKQPCILIQDIKLNEKVHYCQLRDCQIDKDLQKFLTVEEKQKFRQQINPSERNQSVSVLKNITKHVKFIMLFDDKYEYFALNNQVRELSQFSVCIIDQWPMEAILNLYQIPDGNESHHAEIFTRSNSVLLENRVNCMSMAYYQKYVKIFAKIYQQKKQNLLTKQQSLKKMYYKFNQAANTIREWQSKVGFLQNNIIETIENLSKQIQVDKINSSQLSLLKIKYNEKQALIKLKKDELQNTKNDMQKQLKDTKKILEKIEKIINNLQRTQMSELKKIYKTNKLVQFGLQCLCILLKEKQDEVNEKTINKLLADSNLLMKMKSSNLLETKNIELINKFKKQIPSYEVMMKTHTTEVSKILVEWIKSIIQYWETTDFYNIKRADFKVLQKQFKAVSQDFESVKQELRILSEKSNVITSQLKKLEQQKLNKQKQILLIKKSLENSADLIPILLRTQKDISALLNKVTLKLNNLLGNCILVACTIVYLPLKRLSIKSKLIQVCKKYLNNNLVSYSQSYIYDVTSDNFVMEKFDETIETIQNLNIFVLQHFPQQIKVIIDPHRKFLSFIENNKLINQKEKFKQIVEKAQEVSESQFQSQKIYHTTGKKLQISQEKYLQIDWESIETNPEEKLFNRIALSKKPQYFQAKNQLRLKVQENLKKIDDMKNQLFEVITESALKILQDESFLENGRKLFALQQENEILEKEITNKAELIHGLSKEIKHEVKNIFKMLNIFKILRPIGMDLILDIVSKQGNSTQNVLSWILANLPQQKRWGFLLYFVNEITGKKYQELLNEITLNIPLRSNDLKTKKPGNVNLSSWQKILKMSTYSESLKQMIEIVQKHQKQFQVWCNNSQTLLPQNLKPLNLTINEHLFLINHLKPKVFHLSVETLVKKQLKLYELKPMSSSKILGQLNQNFPVVYHGDILKLQKICEQFNKNRMQKVRIGSIGSENQMKGKVWKCMQNQEWMLIYGISTTQNIIWVQKSVQYVLNYQTQSNFRVIILPDSVHESQFSERSLIQSSKYLTSISIHIYDSIPTMNELIRYFPLYPQLIDNFSKVIPHYLEEEMPKSPRVIKLKSRKSSMNQIPQNKITSLLKLDQLTLTNNKKPHTENLLALPEQNQLLDNTSFVVKMKGNNKLMNRLYKHLMLAYLVLQRRFNQKLGKNKFQILKRCVQTLKQIEQNQVPIESNVQQIVSFLVKVYFNEIAFEQRKCLQQILQRIVDENLFSQKIIYDVNIATLSNIEIELQNNTVIFGAQNSFIIKQKINQKKSLFKTLNQLINKQNIKEQTSFLKAAFSKIPIELSNKQIKNLNYTYFYSKEEKFHNQLIKKSKNLLQWINTYEGKIQSTDEQIDPTNEYNWENLVKKVQDLVGYKFDRNMLREVCMSFMQNLRKSHQFLLYFNPSYSSFIINPALVSNLQELVSVYMINYFEVNNIKDAYSYVQNLEFKRISNNSELNQLMFQYGMQGIVFNNLKYRDFKYNFQHQLLQTSNNADLQGEQKAPVIFLKPKKITNSKKDQQETIINMEIRSKATLKSSNQEKIHLTSVIACMNTYPQFNLRDNCLVVDDENNSN